MARPGNGQTLAAWGKRHSGFALAVLALHWALLAWSAWRHSPTQLELFHLPAGISHLALGRFDLCRVNPPLVRMTAALAVMLAGPRIDWRSYDADPLVRAEYSVGLDFAYANGPRSAWLFTVGRWACIPFSIVGALACLAWASRLYGANAGLVALVLWCSCPYVLGHAALLTADAHAAALGVLAAYVFWRWLRTPAAWLALAAGAALGLAASAKFTLLLFYPLWPAFWLVDRLAERRGMTAGRWLREAGLLAVLLISSVLVINVAYGFENSGRPLGSFRFQTLALAGGESVDQIPNEGANRFAGTWLGALPVPVPANYLQGIDTQIRDCERGIWSFLAGNWQTRGWWYFHLYALSIKLPWGTWVLMALAIVVSLRHPRYSAGWRNEFVVLAPIVAMLIALSSQTGMGIHSRYALPLLPFVFIWTSKTAKSFERRGELLAVLTVAALTYSVGSSLWCVPHSLSYFNELVGGPANGWAHLAKSDVSWGQDVLELKAWLVKQPEVDRLCLALSGPPDPRLLGIEFMLPPVAPRSPGLRSEAVPAPFVGPKPGWYAIDVSFLNGRDPLSAPDGRGGWDEPSKREGYDLSYFLRFNPVATVGYSIRVYHVTVAEANRVRRDLGLPPLPGDESRSGRD
jgi:hypothetical protein